MHRLLVAVLLVLGLSFAAPAMADEDTSSASENSSSSEESESNEESEEEAPDESEEGSEETSEEPEPTAEPTEETTEEPAPEPSPTEEGTSEEPEGEKASEDDEGKADEEDPTEPEGELPPEVVEEDAGSVDICHADGAGAYSKESVTADTTAGGHAEDADDIIPPFDHAEGSYDGKNYDDAGKALLENDCAPVVDPDQTALDLQQQRLLEGLVVAAAPQPRITICHATNSPNNPYVVQHPAADGDVSGHADHTGPVFQDGFNNQDDWGDIIPPFNIGDISFPGLNWTAEGQAIFNNGCIAPGQDPDPDPDPGQVVICHAVGGGDFLKLVAPASGTVGGHAAHGSDIIPPFDINGVAFAGLNFDDDGQEIFENDCRESEDDDDDDDGDDSDDSDDEDEAGLPYTGGAPLWTLVLGGGLILGGVALVNNLQFVGTGGLSTGPGSPSLPRVPSWSELLGAQPVGPSRRHALDRDAEASRSAAKMTLTASLAIAVVAFLIRYIVK